MTTIWLDGKHAVFVRVHSGMNVAYKIDVEGRQTSSCRVSRFLKTIEGLFVKLEKGYKSEKGLYNRFSSKLQLRPWKEDISS